MKAGFELKDLAARYQEWATEDLVRAVTVEASEYQAEALALMTAELERRNVSVDRMEEISAAKGSGASRSERSLAGVKGWLGWMVFWVAASSCASLYVAARLLLSDLSAIGWLLFLANGGLGVFGVVATWHLLRWAPQAPRYATAWFVATAILALAYGLWAYRWTGEWKQVGFLPRSLWCGIWCAYLQASSRVKATYSPPDLHEEVVETFS